MCPGEFAISGRALGDQTARYHSLEHKLTGPSLNPEPVGEGQDRAVGAGRGGPQNQVLGGG
jgi:hypothetical protein